MCVVSMVVSDWRERYPNPVAPWNPGQTLPYTPQPLYPQPDRETIQKIMEEIEAARQKDKELGQEDCSEADKKEWLEALERRVAALEAAQRSEEDSKIT